MIKTAQRAYEVGSEGAFTQAALNNEVVVLPLSNQLFIDIDDEASMARYDLNLTKVEEYVGVRGFPVITPSRSGDVERKHIIVTLARDVTPMERILLQALLGSDLRRELLSYCRITIDDPNPTLFLEKGHAQIGPGDDIIHVPLSSCVIVDVAV